MSSYQSLILGHDESDGDAIEMFCGQIPRMMSEDDLRLIFERYGRIFKLNVLRDKQTGESRGCCFLTYHTRQAAVNAQNALHNRLILPGMHHAIQIKPADVENRNERKIFIGMISKLCHEEEIKQLFLPFGVIEECTVLRDLNQRSRGCAFVTYQKRQSALNAIQTMHHACTMDGCSSPMNVRLADTPKDKEVRKMQQKLSESALRENNSIQPSNKTMSPLNLMLFNQLYSNAVSSLSNQQPQSSASVQLDRSSGDHHFTPLSPLSSLFATKVTNERQHSILPLLSPTITDWQNIGALGDYSRSLIGPPNSILHDLDSNLGQYPKVKSKDHLSTPMNSVTHSEIQAFPWSHSSDDDLRLLDGLLSVSGTAMSNVNLSPSFVSVNKQQQNNNNSQSMPTSSDKQLMGPFGSNLFIYHLPSEFTDHDLAQTFSPFGHVLSAKVFIDKLTNRSKCFGFVSYDNIYAAHQAIEQMNGFAIGSKRLKVQLKKSRQ